MSLGKVVDLAASMERDLTDAYLIGAKGLCPLAAARLSIVPAGDLIVWKKLADGSLCKLLIPAAAARSNATGRKCRAEFAVVLEGTGVSHHEPHHCRYTLGETVRADKWDPNRWLECSGGIHFFLTREEAEQF